MADYSYSKKEIGITVTLDKDGAQTDYYFEGYACHVTIDKSGCPEFPKAHVSIKGLSLDVMASMSRLAFEPLARRFNLISIAAGEKGGALSTIFRGEITSAWADFNSTPTVEFVMEARSASYPVLIPQSPMAVSGQQPADDIVKSLTQQIGYNYSNEGVTASVGDCVINGDPITKMRWVANTVGADLIVDDQTIVMLPKGKPRNASGTIPLISADNGMIGYPTFDQQGISVSCFFRPELTIGANVQIASVVPRASGVWKIVNVSHSLSANDPTSQEWVTSIKGMYLIDG